MTPLRISLALAGAVAALGTGAAFAAAGPTGLSAGLNALTNHGETVSTAARNICPDPTSKERDGHGDCVSAVARSEANEKKSAATKHKAEKTADVDTGAADKSNHGDAVSDVAKSKATTGEAHGSAISAVAKSNAGQTTAAAVTQDGHGDATAATHSTTTHTNHP